MEGWEDSVILGVKIMETWSHESGRSTNVGFQRSGAGVVLLDGQQISLPVGRVQVRGVSNTKQCGGGWPILSEIRA